MRAAYPGAQFQPLEYSMLKDVVEVQPTKDYRLRLRFEDGAEGEVDVAVLIEFEGIFAPLKDRNEFLKVFVDLELGTIC